METRHRAQIIYSSWESPSLGYICTHLVGPSLPQVQLLLVGSLFQLDKATPQFPSSPLGVAVCRFCLSHSTSSALINSVIQLPLLTTIVSSRPWGALRPGCAPGLVSQSPPAPSAKGGPGMEQDIAASLPCMLLAFQEASLLCSNHSSAINEIHGVLGAFV